MLRDNSVFFITGASSGLGLAIAERCLAAGHKVVAASRHPENMPLPINSGLIPVQMDISAPDDIELAIKIARDKFGRIDVLVNNAGFGVYGFFEEISTSLAMRQFETNFFGTLNVTRKILPLMRIQKYGWIVTISSVAAVRVNSGMSIYAASKSALEGWMEGMAKEVAQWNIRCMLIEPGAFRTNFFQQGKNMVWPDQPMDCYTPQNKELYEHFVDFHGKQDGNPQKIAKYLLKALDQPCPPFRLFMGKRAWAGLKKYYEDRYDEFLKWSEWSRDSDFD